MRNVANKLREALSIGASNNRVKTLRLGEHNLRGPMVVSRKPRLTAVPVTRVSETTLVHDPREMGPTTPFIRLVPSAVDEMAPGWAETQTNVKIRTDAALMPTVPAERWSHVERSGIAAKPVPGYYRLLGFVTVTAIVIAFVGSLATALFHRFDTSWITPTIVDDKNATFALVPYANAANAKPGSPVYACEVEIFWCRKVGTVLEVVPGEVRVEHPHRDATLRGQMIELRLDDPSAAREDVLFAGSKPLAL